MARKLWRLTVRDEFSAGHALRHYEGKCERLHGHNFAVALTVEGECLEPDTEILLDFKLLKQLLKTALEELDHRILNDVVPFDRQNPSSENLSRHIWRQTARLLEAHPNPRMRAVRLYSVSVSEKDAQTATYLELEA